MSVITSQNWDTPTAPSLPSDWTASGSNPPATSTSGPTPISSPNTLYFQAGSSAVNLATWNNQDGSRGNVLVSWTAIFYSDLEGYASALVRCNASPFVYGSSTGYEIKLDGTNNLLALNSITAGTSSSVFSLSVTGLTTGVWYTIIGTFALSSITLSVQRASDGYYLNESGTFQSGSTTASGIITNSSISGEGYVALAALTEMHGGGSIYFDDFTLETFGFDTPNNLGFPGVARIAAEVPQEPGRAIIAGSRVVPPQAQFGEPGCSSHNPRRRRQAREASSSAAREPCARRTPKPVVLVQEPARPDPGVAIAAQRGRAETAHVPLARPQQVARAESPPSGPGNATYSVNRRREEPFARRPIPPVAAAEATP